MGGLAFPQLDTAIGHAEGFDVLGSIPSLANNPGDIVAGPFASAHGATGSITAAGGQQIAVFPNVEQGTAAMDSLIANNYSGGSIQDLAQHWLGSDAPASSVNDWASNVSQALGVPASTPVASLGAGGGSSSGAPAPSTGPGIISKVVSSAIGGATGFLGLDVSWSRVAAFFLGLIVLAGAIYLFKPVQQAVNTTVKAAVKAAAV